jgi:transposase
VQGDLLMKEKDRKKLHVILQVLEKKLKQKEAAKLLKISVRQIKRICRRVRSEGDGGVLHRNRTRKSNRRIAASIKEKTLSLCQEKYKDFGPTLATEQLQKVEGIKISDETLRLWMKESGIAYRKRRDRPHRKWRERKAHFGEMLQMDGSHHDWLEGRGPWMVLMGYIDDATGRVFARFYEYEGTLPAFDGLMRYIRRYGIPCAVYLDKHSTYKGLRKTSLLDQLEGDPGMSQFERAMNETEITVIHANSPQAKGRIERFFRTAQDRLVKQMRITGINTLQEANRYLVSYLAEHNRKYTRPPANGVDLHRHVPRSLDLKAIFSIQTKRVLRNDFTIMHNGKLYQVLEKIQAKHLIVQERCDGTVHIALNRRHIRSKEIAKVLKPADADNILKRRRLPKTPDARHPWRTSGQWLFARLPR